MPSHTSNGTVLPRITHLKRQVALLEEDYQRALANDEVFQVLKDIRNRINALKILASQAEYTYRLPVLNSTIYPLPTIASNRPYGAILPINGSPLLFYRSLSRNLINEPGISIV